MDRPAIHLRHQPVSSWAPTFIISAIVATFCLAPLPSLFANPLAVQETTEQLRSQGSDKTDVAATVGGEPIRIDRLNLQVELVLTRTPAEGLRLDVIKAQVLQENIKQRLVNLYLQNSKFKASEAEIDLEMENMKRELQGRQSNLEKYLQQRKISNKQLRQETGWTIAWAKYLNYYLTDENLQKFFKKHQRKLDGSQLRVAHILIAPDDETKSADWKAAFAKAQSLSRDLAKNKLTFEEAVVQFSSGATKINKGELGWIDWTGPMTRNFTTAAFQLKPDEISPPVRTSFGFHLIKLLEEKPGSRTPADMRPQLAQRVKRFLFDWLSTRQLAETKVDFTGNFPYFDTQTGALLGSSHSQSQASPAK